MDLSQGLYQSTYVEPLRRVFSWDW